MAGLPVAEEVFRQLDPDIRLTREVAEGDRVSSGTVWALWVGDSRSAHRGAGGTQFSAALVRNRHRHPPGGGGSGKGWTAGCWIPGKRCRG